MGFDGGQLSVLTSPNGSAPKKLSQLIFCQFKEELNCLTGSGFVRVERGSNYQQPALHPQHPHSADVSALHHSDTW